MKAFFRKYIATYGQLKLFFIVALIVGTLFFVVVVIAKKNQPHGGVYNEVRQCGNIRLLAAALEDYKNKNNLYPEVLPSLGYPLRTFTESLSFMNTYEYRKVGDGYELTFLNPRQKSFTVHSFQETQVLCKTGHNIK